MEIPKKEMEKKKISFSEVLDKIAPNFKRLNNIQTSSQLVDLIENTYNFDKQTEKQIFDKIMKLEILEFIFSPKDQFLLEAATRLSYKCLMFLKNTKLGDSELQEIFGRRTQVTREFVKNLKKKNLNSQRKKEFLSALLYFNEEGVRAAIKDNGGKLKKLIKDFPKKAPKIQGNSDKSGQLLSFLKIELFKIMILAKKMKSSIDISQQRKIDKKLKELGSQGFSRMSKRSENILDYQMHLMV